MVQNGPLARTSGGFGVSVLQQKASDWFEPLSPASSTLGGRVRALLARPTSCRLVQMLESDGEGRRVSDQQGALRTFWFPAAFTLKSTRVSISAG